MNLMIGIDKLKPGWHIVLKQIGVNFEELDFSKPLSSEDHSVIIITEPHNYKENETIKLYLNNGGAVLYSDSAVIGKVNFKTKKTSYLCSEHNTPFMSMGVVDIFSEIRIPKSNMLRSIDSGLYITSLKNRINLILPFNINKLITSSNSRRKKFYTHRNELPSEIVSEVSKGKIRWIVSKSLEYLHHKRELPFVHLYSQPYIDKNLFIFRLDTDFCSKKDAEEMYTICRKNKIQATWFLDTESDKRLDYYNSMQNQEMAVHCNRHFVYDNIENNFENIKRADDKLRDYNIFAKGFAAPFGDWNCFLDQALQKMEFSYSSEFTLDYDNYPFYPFCQNEFSSVLQIPIHPISLGRLIRSHFDEEEMLQYYLETIKEKKYIGEPVIIYHHPHHKNFGIFDKIFKFINSHGFENMSMIDYRNWWENRLKLEPVFRIKNNKLSAKINSDSVYVKVTTRKGFAILGEGDNQIEKIKLTPHPKYRSRKDLKKTRKFHWRDLLYNYESKRSKKAFQ